ncbi:MAG TPA: response regulator [Cyanobacteria bacterium UBA11149]|nr:response regulator [Cyanobacteria bacterium UBA11367]HBE58149.1 response regulator [Cyanobacteria bacterium UBA11366]HBK66621.1 response regulator [Cyanobacteria bacterium UBA11166]HBR72149.1 response regulator [Cyanobacteria bacterium UBA11159]HBS72663.1 response regulator [Cyanobacteria bacterium UBA11153]HBW89740.1 response regulator [Cyanobacteria bacterium UBA11149]HCA97911.1 response regulator [Cyanobacteria bacterium UBA9226]
MSKLVLVIEDDEIVRASIFDLLEMENFNVVGAGDGVSALSLAREVKPDVVLCDMYIPEINGCGVLEELRKTWSREEMPFILFTSDYDPEIRNRAFALGANDLILKPLDIDDILNSVYKATGITPQSPQ